MDFATPLGVTRTDRAFVEALERHCGNLRAHEYDHAREHSVELQLLICQHLWGAQSFELVAALCPDPCGPTGTAPRDGCGADLGEFGAALRDAIAANGADTLVIAGADLSHIGAHFGDERALDDAFCAEVSARDGAALAHLEANAPTHFVAEVARDDNPTRVCSAGCIYAAMTALPDAQVRVLRYHQAVDADAQVGVTCAAAVFTQ
jgi:AmmeMemoRadiSam system protein B